MRIQTTIGLLLLTNLLLAPSVQAERELSVELAPVEQAPVFDEVPLSGTVNSLQVATLAAAVSGQIVRVQIEAGQEVGKGEALYTLDDAAARYALQGIDAELDAARARLQEARRRSDEAQSVGAGQNIAATELAARQNQVALAQAAVQQLEANRRLQQVLVGRHQISAPFSGVISERLRELGEWVEPGDSLAVLVNHRQLRLDFEVPQQAFRRMAGLPRLTLLDHDANNQAGSGAEHIIQIERSVPVGNAQSRTFRVRAIPPAELTLLPGMAVQAVLRVPLGEEALSVPADAVNRYPEGRTTVWIAASEGGQVFRVGEQRVETGHRFGDRVVIRSGLKAGQQVVSRGNESLQPGMRVRVLPAGQP